MNFNRSCLGGDLTIIKLIDTPMKAQAPAARHHTVAFSLLVSGAVTISATDWLHPT
jgi:PhnB protein